ncbi:DUF5689 domain-containing protein [Marinifilum sp. D737]|uniref:DUF5689 domain-containing protein n=1 Tax=Marinifilum sp. D737 TaxID=2969628 RepID=UPI002272D66F|nr:DUF5689 domain-containing protein [Marinifilum sp. D737]MCY1635944.1 DUF5689 domain-containing protein [Marinifilum sp. D737]
MKSIKKFFYAALITAGLATSFVACVDNDFDQPEIMVPEYEGASNTSITDLKAKHTNGEFETIEEDLVIEGYVVSDDTEGNFYKQIIVQDSREGATGGIEVKINEKGLSSMMKPGQQVFIKVKGLVLGDYNGLVQLGGGTFQNGKYTNLAGIDPGLIKDHIFLNGLPIELQPKEVSLEELKDNDLYNSLVSTLVKITAAQFEDADGTLTYAEKDKSSNRDLVGPKGNKLIVRNSGYSNFYDEVLPQGSGTIVGVLSKFGNDKQMMIRSLEDVDMTGERFDGSTGGGSAGEVTLGNAVTSLNETFDAIVNYEDVAFEGWNNVYTEGTRKWQGKEYNGTKYAQASEYNSEDAKNVSWLITPGLDVTNAENKIFNFETKNGYNTGATLKVLISTDLATDVNSATWTELSANIASGTADKYSDWVKSGDIDLSGYNGTVYIAFKYEAEAGTKGGTFQVDNVKFNTVAAPPADVTVTELNEAFDNVTAESDVALEGWFVGATAGDRNWIGKEYSGNKYIQASGYNSELDAMEAWVVTPGLDLDAAANKNFSFETKAGYSKDETLEVFIATDFNKDLAAANWQPLTVTLAPKNATGYSSEFTNSGDIDLSSYSGTVHIAFKYTGSKDNSGTWQLDNVKFNYTEGGGDTGGGDNGGDTNAASLFPGSDFEDWNAFTGALNNYGLKSYVEQSTEGRNGGKAMQIKTTPTGNDYVFTATVPEGFDATGKTKIVFYIKGTSGKSLSLNVYKADGYARFNLGDYSAEATIEPSSSNSYTGTIDTSGEWVKVTLNITDVALQTTAGESLFALKVGKEQAYDLLVDDITIE